MSDVQLSTLAEALQRYPMGYVLTANGDRAPHASPVSIELEAGVLVVSGIGRHTRENAVRQPAVGLVWPPQSVEDYSLFVDGTAEVTERGMRITPTRAVLHRPVPSPVPKDAGTCQSDCIELAFAP